VGLLGPNADGELPQPGRVPDCYLGLRLDPPAAETPEVLVVAPAALLHPAVPQPDGTVLYALVTGHPDRAPRELVFVADLTVELRAWPRDTWAKVGIDPQAAAGAVVARSVLYYEMASSSHLRSETSPPPTVIRSDTAAIAKGSPRSKLDTASEVS
jgi:hypothetical protein